LNLPIDTWSLFQDPSLDLPQPDAATSETERFLMRVEARSKLRPRIAEMLSDVPVEQLLPLIRDQRVGAPDAATRPLNACTDLFRPVELTRAGVLNLVRIDLVNDAAAPDATGVLSDGWTVYASADNLYVAQTSQSWWWGFDEPDLETHVHKFALGAGQGQTRYAASGRVQGWLLNQFSMSEYEGNLRVASTDFGSWGTLDGQANNVTVLTERAGSLVEVGFVGGIAPGEQIYAARMMGPKGYVVTFRQTDPLFTIDLSDPTHPQVVGELEIPGYSGYLHPIDDDHLLAIGMDGTDTGQISGLAVSVFDVTDFANPQRSQYYVLGDNGWGWSEALNDHHAFTYHRGVLSIPASFEDYEFGNHFAGLVVMEAGVDGISELGRVNHADLASAGECPYMGADAGLCDGYVGSSWNTEMRRSIYLEDKLVSISGAGLKFSELTAPETELASVLLPY
jgi:hypothetical protein